MSSSRFLQRVEFREIKTFFTVSEMLECGHRFESLGQVGADPLTARHRVCQKCAQAASLLPPKKPAQAVPREPAWRARKSTA